MRTLSLKMRVSALLSFITLGVTLWPTQSSEVFQRVNYRTAVLNTPERVPVRKGSIQWPPQQNYQNLYSVNERVWWYIPVQQGWSLDLYLTYYHLSWQDRMTIWKVKEESCNSTTCIVDISGFEGHHHVLFLPAQAELTLNESIVIEFHSVESFQNWRNLDWGTGFKLTWISYPTAAAFNHGRMVGSCCAKASHELENESFICRQYPLKVELCSCESFSAEIPYWGIYGDEALFVRLEAFGQQSIEPIDITMEATPELDTQRYLIQANSLSRIFQFSGNVDVAAECPWSGFLRVEWFEVDPVLSQFSPFSNESDDMIFKLILNHKRLPAETAETGVKTRPYYTEEQMRLLVEGQEIINVTSKSGHITSPDFPASYPSSCLKTWVIQVPPYYTFEMDFPYFNTEERADFLRVFYGGRPVNESADVTQMVAKYTGFMIFQRVRWPGENYHQTVWLTFQSDNNTEYDGFNMTYRVYNPNKPDREETTATSLSPLSTKASSPEKWLAPVLVLVLLVVFIIIMLLLCRRGYCTRIKLQIDVKFHGQSSPSADGGFQVTTADTAELAKSMVPTAVLPPQTENKHGVVFHKGNF